LTTRGQAPHVMPSICRKATAVSEATACLKGRRSDALIPHMRKVRRSH
jgi:hypothetical protein